MELFLVSHLRPLDFLADLNDLLKGLDIPTHRQRLGPLLQVQRAEDEERYIAHVRPTHRRRAIARIIGRAGFHVNDIIPRSESSERFFLARLSSLPLPDFRQWLRSTRSEDTHEQSAREAGIFQSRLLGRLPDFLLPGVQIDALVGGARVFRGSEAFHACFFAGWEEG